VLDDVSSTDYFLTWAGDFGSSANLRGGNRVVSDVPSEAQIDIEVSPSSFTRFLTTRKSTYRLSKTFRCYSSTPSNILQSTPSSPLANSQNPTVPLTKHEISSGRAKTPAPTAFIDKSTQFPAAATPGPQHLSGAFPATPQNAPQQMKPSESRVTSVAHRYHNKHPGPRQSSPRPIAINKLDAAPNEKCLTPMQQKLLGRVEPGDHGLVSRNAMPSATQPREEISRSEPEEVNKGKSSKETSNIHVTQDTAETTYSNHHSTMGVFDAMEKQYFSSGLSSGFNPAAEEFHVEATKSREYKSQALRMISDIVYSRGCT